MKVLGILPAFLLAAALGACDAGTAPEEPGVVPVASVLVQAPDSVLAVDSTVQLAATTLSPTGSVLAGRAITWSSSDTTVATVSVAGLVTARKQGSATVSARSESSTGTLQLTIWQGSCYLTFPPRLGVGASRPAQLYVYTREIPTPPVRNPVVTSSNPAVATVSAAGVVTGVAPGTTTLEASCDGTAPTRRMLQVLNGFEVTMLGTLGGTASTPWDLNERGEVVGEARTAAGATHAFLWRDGKMTDLGTPGASSRALGVSSNGLVVGSYTDLAGDVGHRPFLWTEGVITLLDPAAEEESVLAVAVNNAGLVVGYSETRSNTATVGSALTWSGAKRTDHGRMDGYSSRFVRINDAGQLLGVTVSGGFPSSGSFVQTGGARSAIPYRATGLASNGVVAGIGEWFSDRGQSSYLLRDGALTVFATGRHTGVYATDVNAGGTVVGTRSSISERSYGFLTEGTAVVPLGQLVVDLPAGWEISAANGINDRGDIIAVATQTASGRTEAVLLRRPR